MEAQLHRPSHGHEDGGHEKKSVLKKVKDKAKKMKDTIKKHGHHHHNEEEENHQVHGGGAPIHESTVVKSINLPKESSSNPNNTPLPTPTERSDDELVSEQQNPQLNEKADEKDSSTDTLAAKISSATTAVAISAKNIVASTLDGSKEYLKPGDEDKALSSAITNALQKKEEPKEPKRGKVTVSKEVAERLGTTQENTREREDALASGEESSGQGVAERLQNAVSSWLGKSNGIETAQDSLGQAFVSDAAGTISKER
ncbi:low-temperature-induced 65 kDa protein-like isoform X2 [Salvia hispanica]|uniref:low-temperature-induced 65 kDa protein-like isoform X2 n=1 Tax=Salvia hispanica TaxID=49212 RepID=UPI0020095229|nr:low-temperature-induced 65 kDa protein-like isoform X2 [Salvia hispanica]